MFVNTRAEVEKTIGSARIYFAKKSLSMFLFEYMKGKDYSTNVKGLDYLMSLIEVLELSLVIDGLNMTPVASKVRRIIGPVVASGANQIPPLEIITAETVFAPDGIYGLGRKFYDKDVLTTSEGCPSGSLVRVNALKGETDEDAMKAEGSSDVLMGKDN